MILLVKGLYKFEDVLGTIVNEKIEETNKCSLNRYSENDRLKSLFYRNYINYYANNQDKYDNNSFFGRTFGCLFILHILYSKL